jgi:UDP-glucose 4-epimerase
MRQCMPLALSERRRRRMSAVQTRSRLAVLGAGFIGLNLVQRLGGAGAEVAVLDHKPPPESLPKSVRWVCGEFGDTKALSRTLEGARVAFHLLSTTVPGDEHVDISRELSENTLTTLTFLDICEQLGVGRVVFASSSSVYGVQSRMPIAETAATDPISSHGIQKLAIEKYLLLRRYLRGFDVRIARLSNPYGPGQKVYGRQGFVAMTIGHLLRNEPIPLRDAGRPVRDFIYIDDVTDALHRLAACEQAPPVVNIGSGIGHSLHQLVELMNEALGRPLTTISAAPRRTDIPVSVLDVRLAGETIGFRTTVSLPEGLRRTFRHHGIDTVRLEDRGAVVPVS